LHHRRSFEGSAQNLCDRFEGAVRRERVKRVRLLRRGRAPLRRERAGFEGSARNGCGLFEEGSAGRAGAPFERRFVVRRWARAAAGLRSNRWVDTEAGRGSPRLSGLRAGSSSSVPWTGRRRSSPITRSRRTTTDHWLLTPPNQCPDTTDATGAPAMISAALRVLFARSRIWA
jgi:hypothetical protein